MITVQRMPTDERRNRKRNPEERRATSLIQAIVRDPTKAAERLEADLRSGADLSGTMALLAATESVASLRGIDLGSQIAAIRQHLKRAGFQA
jgi:hypothetical protein